MNWDHTHDAVWEGGDCRIHIANGPEGIVCKFRILVRKIVSDLFATGIGWVDVGVGFHVFLRISLR